jgi:hypothetical protein
MNQQAALRVNQPEVVSETIDGEVIIINLDSGTYYSLNDLSAAVWTYIEQGASVNQIVGKLSAVYAANANLIATELPQFVEQLLAENLIVENGAESASPSDDDLSLPPVFSTPTLEKFSDMQDLLLLDPIHDVDEAGWPLPEQN